MHTWKEALAEEKQAPYFQGILDFVAAERAAGQVVFPPQKDVFNAFKYTEFGDVRVVILGQDPYHGSNQAHGLCFSVAAGVRPPPSLQNIYKELARDIAGFQIPNHGLLTPWTAQGVLLLNTVLTVRQGQAHSHSKIGWERFTDKVIAQLNQHRRGIVFLLWGSHAHKKGAVIDGSKHLVLKTTHPSPLSAHRGFLGSGHFSRTNLSLQEQGQAPIDWQI